MSPPPWLELLCAGGERRGFVGFDTWVCARCLGMLAGVPLGVWLWPRRWGARVALACLLASASLCALQHVFAQLGDSPLLRAALGAAFGLSWAGICVTNVPAAWLRPWRWVALSLPLAFALGAALALDGLRGHAELAAYGFMLLSFGVALAGWLRGGKLGDRPPVAAS